MDTSVLIAHARGQIDLEECVSERAGEEFFLSVISASELLHGVHRATESRIKTRRSAWVEGILLRFPILQIDLATARVHSQIWAELAGQGKIIGPHDLWLAATCIAHGLTIVTNNVREFNRISGLDVESWPSKSV